MSQTKKIFVTRLQQLVKTSFEHLTLEYILEWTDRIWLADHNVFLFFLFSRILKDEKQSQQIFASIN